MTYLYCKVLTRHSNSFLVVMLMQKVWIMHTIFQKLVAVLGLNSQFSNTHTLFADEFAGKDLYDHTTTKLINLALSGFGVYFKEALNVNKNYFWYVYTQLMQLESDHRDYCTSMGKKHSLFIQRCTRYIRSSEYRNQFETMFSDFLDDEYVCEKVYLLMRSILVDEIIVDTHENILQNIPTRFHSIGLHTTADLITHTKNFQFSVIQKHFILMICDHLSVVIRISRDIENIHNGSFSGNNIIVKQRQFFKKNSVTTLDTSILDAKALVSDHLTRSEEYLTDLENMVRSPLLISLQNAYHFYGNHIA
jgi:hypothetical protein